MGNVFQVIGRVILVAGLAIMINAAVDVAIATAKKAKCKRKLNELNQLKAAVAKDLTNLDLEINLKRKQWYNMTFEEQCAFKQELIGRYVNKCSAYRDAYKGIADAYSAAVMDMINAEFVD